MGTTARPLRSILRPLVVLGLSLLVFSSCIPSFSKSSSGSGTRKGSNSVSNSADSLMIGYGRVLADNPAIVSKNPELGFDVDLGTVITPTPVFITTNATLNKACVFGSATKNDCFNVYNTMAYPQAITSIGGKWAYTPNSDEFLAVNTYYHVSKAMERMHSALAFALAQSQTYSAYYKSAIPVSLMTNGGYWFKDGIGSTLSVYSKCKKEDNAYFIPATDVLCFGESTELPGLKYAEDPTIIYHEFAHAMQHIFLNMRNVAYDNTYPLAPIVTRSQMGTLFYDEGGSLGEGISDYYDYVMNGRTHMGEWAMAHYSPRADRPMSENDSVHIAGISTSSDSRLSYPRYLQYDPFNASENVEDVHYAGMIASHYLVALTESIKTTCLTDHTTATNYVLYFLAETLAELGDLSGRGSDAAAAGEYRSNLAPGAKRADIWAHIANPITFRRFIQTFAKYETAILPRLCTAYSANQAEKLLDNYGLLIFKNYNRDGNDATTGHLYATCAAGPGTNCTSSSNRVNSVLISKNLIGLPSDANVTQGILLDSQEALTSAVANLSFLGQVTSVTYPDLRYNNGNISFSPGEVVALAPNLINNSNSPMAGIEILGNDWDHMKVVGGVRKPCIIDNWPLSSEGGVTDTDSSVVGNCSHTTRTNGQNSSVPSDIISPVCLVQLSNDNETTWVSQKEFKNSMGLTDNECLGQNPYSCLVRTLPGADHAFYSKLDPQKNFLQTLQGSSSSVPSLVPSQTIFLELNKEISPGTTFLCRFRVRFSNCSDCFTDPSTSTTVNDDYLDYDYAGAKPFKVINFKFTVIN